jgi:hypothetical protein
VAWARSAVRQCREAGVACFMKQLGARPHDAYEDRPEPGCNCREAACEHEIAFARTNWLHLKSAKGGDPSEWPEDLRIREFPR